MKIDKRYFDIPYIFKRLIFDLTSRFFILINFKNSIFNFKSLSLNINEYNPRIFYKEKHHYGHYKILKELNLNDKKVSIDHGAAYVNGFYENYKVNERFFDYSSLVVSSDLRAKTIIKNIETYKINSSLKTVYSVGPYISYVNTHISEDKIKRIKSRLGRTVVVFPNHSIERRVSSDSSQKFKNFIKSLFETHNTVLVCMYWKDIQLNRYKQYTEMGCKIVTAGHRADSNFINRLKTIISIADYSVSNAIGTHVGYCIKMGVPHKIHLEEHEIDGLSLDKKDLYKALDTHKKIITEEQLEIVERYWGKNIIKIYNLNSI